MEHPVHEITHLGLRAKVHTGFYNAWTAKGLDLQVVGHMQVSSLHCAASSFFDTLKWHLHVRTVQLCNRSPQSLYLAGGYVSVKWSHSFEADPGS